MTLSAQSRHIRATARAKRVPGKSAWWPAEKRWDGSLLAISTTEYPSAFEATKAAKTILWKREK